MHLSGFFTQNTYDLFLTRSYENPSPRCKPTGYLKTLAVTALSFSHLPTKNLTGLNAAVRFLLSKQPTLKSTILAKPYELHSASLHQLHKSCEI